MGIRNRMGAHDGKYPKFPARFPALTILCFCVLSACAHPAPAVLHGNTALISGRGTAHDNPGDAARKVFIEAAAITLDHGYRYFEIVDSADASSTAPAPGVRPGADVTIRVFGAGEVRPQTPGVWDAQAIAAGQLPD
jgi:hypothetical protein